MAVENMQTAYQVGKGMLKHVEEMARQAELRENPPAVEPEVEPEPEIEEDEEIIMAEAVLPETDEVAVTEVPVEEEPAFAPTPRRMKFTTAQGTAA